MSTPKSRQQERSGGNTLVDQSLVDPLERDPGFALENPRLDPLYSDAGKEFPLPDPKRYWTEVAKQGIDLYRPSVENLRENLSPEAPVSKNEFSVRGELVNSWKVVVATATETQPVFQSKPEEAKPIHEVRKAGAIGDESFFDFVKGRINFGLLLKATKGLFNLGVDTIKNLGKTTKEATTTNPDTRTPEQISKETEQRRTRQIIEGNIIRAENERARVESEKQQDLAVEAKRVGVLDIEPALRVALMGQDQNLSSNPLESRSTIHAVAKAYGEFLNRQKKQVKLVENNEAGFNTQEGEYLKGGENFNHYTRQTG